jgi:hypothetical protein
MLYIVKQQTKKGISNLFIFSPLQEVHVRGKLVLLCLKKKLTSGKYSACILYF